MLQISENSKVMNSIKRQLSISREYISITFFTIEHSVLMFSQVLTQIFHKSITKTLPVLSINQLPSPNTNNKNTRQKNLGF